jgi:FtsZ-interacting cell division protein YlmF
MASFLRRTMVMLGLVDDDEYDDYEHYDEPVAPVRARPAVVDPMEPMNPGPVRALPRERDRDLDTGGVTLQARPAVVRAVQSPRVHVVQPEGFNDAQEIGDRLKTGQPVIVNLQEVDSDLSRRLIDFCSGATYVLDAKMKPVARRVFLLTPSNVEVSDEEKRRLQERGLYSPNHSPNR